MRTEELLTLKKQLYAIADKLSVLKGRGYGSEEDTLTNLRIVEFLGVMPAELGTWVRLSDKVMRLGRILKAGEEYVGFEGLIDNVVDGINYFAYIPVLIAEKNRDFRELLMRLGSDSAKFLGEFLDGG